MIPWIEWTTVQVGPLTLYVWGLFVALGFLFAAFVAGRFAEKNGGDKKVIYDLVVWMMIAGMVGGRLGYAFFYDVSGWFENPASIFAVWDGGMSLFGGLFLSIIIGVWFLKKKQVDVWKYAEASAFGLPFGLWIGRIGCFLIHDHPGTATDFALGVEYPDGVVRHDHGLYLSINGFLMAMVFWWLSRKKRPIGTYIGIFLVWYGCARLFLDVFRTIDVRYLGLTPAQYFGIAIALAGGVLLQRIHNNPKRYERNAE